LSFCDCMQDSEEDGAFILARLPTEFEATAIRAVLSIPKARHLSEERWAALFRAGFDVHCGRSGPNSVRVGWAHAIAAVDCWREIVAVPSARLSERYQNVENYLDLPEITLGQIEHFFCHYKDLDPGKWIKVERWGKRRGSQAGRCRIDRKGEVAKVANRMRQQL
jgi:Inorganic pyrophosphatase